MSFARLEKNFGSHKYILLGLGVLALAVYLNGLNNSFVSDDIAWIPQNPQLGDWGWLLKFPDRVAMWVVFFVAHAVGGLSPLFYRLFNVFFHIGNTLVIYLLFNLLYKDKKLAIFVSSLFAVHPVLVESVTWIAGGSHAMYGFAFLVSFLFYVLSYHPLSLAAFILAQLFSEKAVSLAAIFVIYEIACDSFSKHWRKLIPYFVLTAGAIFIQLSKVGTRIGGLATQNQVEPRFYNPLIQIPTAIAEYLKLIFWPQALTLYHSEMSFSQGEYLLRLLVFLALTGTAIYAYRKSRYVFFWLSFFVITLAPTLTPLQIAWVVAERYVYLGTLGVLAVAALVLKKLSDLEQFRVAVYSVFVLIIVLLSARTVRRNRDWKNQDTLWLATAKTSPSSPQNRNNLGDLYGRRGDLERSVEEFKKAIELKPGYADAYHNLGNTYQQMGRVEEAIENYQKAIEFNPQLWQSYQNLGAIYFEQGEYELAEECFQEAIKINPTNLNLQENLKIIQGF